MTVDEAIKTLEVEVTCVKRETCARQECADCDLVMPSDQVLSAFGMAISALRAQQEQQKNEPLTNADRIRAMSDEELATYIMWLMAYGANSISGSVLDWLQQPAGGADDENL